jgi:hypothetical protein
LHNSSWCADGSSQRNHAQIGSIAEPGTHIAPHKE